MKVNLKKAAGLSAALASAQVRLDHSFAVDIYADQPSEELVGKLREQFQSQIAMSLAISTGSFAIRHLIGKANEGRVNDLLNRRALVDKQLTFLNGIPSRRIGTNIVALHRAMEAQLAAAGEKPVLYGARGLTLELETETILAPVLRNLRRSKRDLDDELQAVNFNTTIELPADVVQILTDLDLV